MTTHIRRTNAQFLTAPEAEVFRRACALAGVQPTRRQASKWRMHKGSARNFTRTAIRQLSEEQREKDAEARMMVQDLKSVVDKDTGRVKSRQELDGVA